LLLEAPRLENGDVSWSNFCSSVPLRFRSLQILPLRATHGLQPCPRGSGRPGHNLFLAGRVD
jgi:hypothetical protein